MTYLTALGLNNHMYLRATITTDTEIFRDIRTIDFCSIAMLLLVRLLITLSNLLAQTTARRSSVQLILFDTLRPRRAKILGSSSPLTKFSCPHLPEVVLSSSFRLIAESCSRVPHGTIQNPKILVSLVLVA